MRYAFIVSLVAGLTFITAADAAAQRRDGPRPAVDRCRQELLMQTTRDLGGRNPDVLVDARRLRQEQLSYAETRLTGPARYIRDGNDRGRELTFTCIVDGHRASANVTYAWTGGGSRVTYPAPNDAIPAGRMFFSGGIVGRQSGKCLDVEGRSPRDQANIQQWTCSGGSNQLWDLVDLGRGEYSIVNQGTRKALDVETARNPDGANVFQNRWHNGQYQRWRIQRVSGDTYRIVNATSGLCLDVQGAERRDGANVQQWSCSGGSNQTWILRK